LQLNELDKLVSLQTDRILGSNVRFESAPSEMEDICVKQSQSPDQAGQKNAVFQSKSE